MLPAESSGRRGLALWLLLKSALYLVVLAAIIQTLKNLLPNPFSASMLSAVVVSLAASRLGLEEEQGVPPSKQLMKAALPAVLIGVLLVLAALVHGAKVSPALPGASLAFSAMEALALAYRNELWLRGMPLDAARRANVPDKVMAIYLPLVGLSAISLSRVRTFEGAVLALVASAFFTLLWLRFSSRWVVICAHASWLLVSEGLLVGELATLGKEVGRVGSGATASGLAAWLASAAFLVMGFWVWRKTNTPPASLEGPIQRDESASSEGALPLDENEMAMDGVSNGVSK